MTSAETGAAEPDPENFRMASAGAAGVWLDRSAGPVPDGLDGLDVPRIASLDELPGLLTP